MIDARALGLGGGRLFLGGGRRARGLGSRAGHQSGKLRRAGAALAGLLLERLLMAWSAA